MSVDPTVSHHQQIVINGTLRGSYSRTSLLWSKGQQRQTVAFTRRRLLLPARSRPPCRGWGRGGRWWGSPGRGWWSVSSGTSSCPGISTAASCCGSPQRHLRRHKKTEELKFGWHSASARRLSQLRTAPHPPPCLFTSVVLTSREAITSISIIKHSGNVRVKAQRNGGFFENARRRDSDVHNNRLLIICSHSCSQKADVLLRCSFSRSYQQDSSSPLSTHRRLLFLAREFTAVE